MGLDLALAQTGLVILTEHGSLLRHFTLSYPLTRRKRSEPPITEADRIQRLINLTNEIVGITKDYKVRYVALEGFAYAKQFQAHQLGEVAGNLKVQMWLARKILVQVVPPKTARKHFLGYGNPSKEQIMEVVQDRLGLCVDNDHEADAYVIARYLFDEVAGREKEMANNEAGEKARGASRR